MTMSFLSPIVVISGWNLAVLLLLAKATIILAAAFGITLAMQRTSATARHLVWLVALVSLLLVPVLGAWTPIRIAILPPQAAAAATPVARAARGTERSPIVFGGRSSEFNGTAGAVSPALESPRVAPRPAPAQSWISGTSAVFLLLGLWAIVVLAMLATLAWAALSVRRIVRGAQPLDSNDWRTPLYEIADRIGLDDAPRLLQSTEAKMPFACGIRTPTIVLPAESETWTLDRRRAVLLHELAHVRRHDLIGHTLARLVCAMYWFHPLAWSAAKRLRSESERACDDLALACGTRATDYAEHLLDIVTSVRGDSTPLVALAMARRKEFEGRMLAILDPDLRHSAPSRRQSVALIAALALLSLTVGAIAPVARAADAAVVNAGDTIVGRARTVSRDTAIDAPLPPRARANVAVHRESTTSVSTQQRLAVSTIEQSSSSTHETHQTSEQAINAIANAGARFGMSVAASTLRALGQESVHLGHATGSRLPSADPSERATLLARVLKTDTSATLRRIAAWGLQEYAGEPVAAEALSNALARDAEWKVRDMAAWALGDGDAGARAVDALRASLKSDANERVRATSAWALGNLGDDASVDALVAALADPSLDVRERAAWAIGNSSPSKAPRALVALLGDKEPRVRKLAAWALHNIADPSTAPAIASAIKTEQNSDVHLALIRSLASFGDDAVDALKGLLDSPDPRVKAMVVHALAGRNASGPWPWPWPEPRPFP